MECGEEGSGGRVPWRDSRCAAAHVIVALHRRGFWVCLSNGLTGGAPKHVAGSPRAWAAAGRALVDDVGQRLKDFPSLATSRRSALVAVHLAGTLASDG